jgi:hypothetical protein
MLCYIVVYQIYYGTICCCTIKKKYIPLYYILTCNAMLCPYNLINFHIVIWNFIKLYDDMLCYIVLPYVKYYRMMLYSVKLHCIMFRIYSLMWCSDMTYYIMLYYIVLCCVILCVVQIMRFWWKILMKWWTIRFGGTLFSGGSMFASKTGEITSRTGGFARRKFMNMWRWPTTHGDAGTVCIVQTQKVQRMKRSPKPTHALFFWG